MGECCIYAYENGCSTYLHLKVALRDQILNNKYVLHLFLCVSIQYFPIPTCFLKREGEMYTSLYEAHIYELKVGLRGQLLN